MCVKIVIVPLFNTLLAFIQTSSGQCTTGMCEKTSLSLSSDVHKDNTLRGFVLETLNVSNWEECFSKCARNCRCLSFNMNIENSTENCELNDANARLAPESLTVKQGVDYYEPTRKYLDSSNGAHKTCSNPSCYKCCDSAPCQNGGTCHEVCDVENRRFNCTCSRGFGGYKCHVPLPPHSCADIHATNGTTANGIYEIRDDMNNWFPVFCDFNSEPGASWTLIESHSFANKNLFGSKAFSLFDLPINQDAPEWSSYRLSKSRMKSIRDYSSHWRATCNFPTDGIIYVDYARASLKSFDPLPVSSVDSQCVFYELINIRGMQCVECTAWTWQTSIYHLHIDGVTSGCDFQATSGAVFSEDSLGLYIFYNDQHRCASSSSSTTQYWFGSF